MAVYHDARCRLCRREGMKLFLKGDALLHRQVRDRAPRLRARASTARAAASRRPTTARSCARSRRRAASTACSSASSATTSRRPARPRASPARCCCRCSSAVSTTSSSASASRRSRSAARQLVRHGHFMVNGRKVDIPSFLVKAGDDDRRCATKSRKLAVMQSALESRKGQGVAGVARTQHRDALRGRMLNIPTRASIPVPVNEQLIVELYSK